MTVLMPYRHDIVTRLCRENPGLCIIFRGFPDTDLRFPLSANIDRPTGACRADASGVSVPVIAEKLSGSPIERLRFQRDRGPVISKCNANDMLLTFMQQRDRESVALKILLLDLPIGSFKSSETSAHEASPKPCVSELAAMHTQQVH